MSKVAHPVSHSEPVHRHSVLRLFPDTQVSFIRSGTMISKISIAVALAGAVAVAVSAQAANVTCDTSLLNTTSSTYYVGTANKTIYDIAVEVNRGVCDIGRANLSMTSCFTSLIYQIDLTLIQWSTYPSYQISAKPSSSPAKSAPPTGLHALSPPPDPTTA